MDAEGLHVYPGFVEAHGHIGLDGYGIGYEGMDYNEMNDIVTPHLRGIDGVKPMDAAFPHAAAGVTCVCVGPGSANVLGGTFTTIKTVGKRVDDMVVRDGVAMKCAFGENPKRVYRDKKDSSRMTTAALLREMLFKTREYMEKKEAAKAASEKKEAVKVPEKKKAAAPAKKETAKAAPKKKAVSGKKAASNAAEKKEETVIAASVISSDDIHEKKFEAVSRIYCELPTYLL